MTQHEKYLQRQDGAKYVIQVEAMTYGKTLHYVANVFRYDSDVAKFVNVFGTNSDNVGLSARQLKEAFRSEQLKHVTIEEIQQAAEELWAKLKPDFYKGKVTE